MVKSHMLLNPQSVHGSLPSFFVEKIIGDPRGRPSGCTDTSSIDTVRRLPEDLKESPWAWPCVELANKAWERTRWGMGHRLGTLTRPTDRLKMWKWLKIRGY